MPVTEERPARRQKKARRRAFSLVALRRILSDILSREVDVYWKHREESEAKDLSQPIYVLVNLSREIRELDEKIAVRRVWKKVDADRKKLDSYSR